MSLGYMQGNTWIADKRYEYYSEWEPYKKLIWAAAAAGFSWRTEFSYASRKYHAEISVLEGRQIVYHENAYDPHPITALLKAIARRGVEDPMVRVLCLELECLILREKLLPMKKLETALEDLTDSILLRTVR